MNVLIHLDGVLRGETGDRIDAGVGLYRALKEACRVTLMTGLSREMAEGWLTLQNIIDYDDLITDDGYADGLNVSALQRAVGRSRGRVDLLVVSSPAEAAAALLEGFTTLLFAHPQYMRPEFRPDAPKGVRSWDDVVTEITKQQALKAADRRLREDV